MARLMKILVPVDFSPPCQAAVGEALLLARRFDACVEFLHVWRPAPTPEDSASRSLSTFAASEVGQAMRQYLERAEQEGVVASGRLGYGNPEMLILDSAVGFDLIVMGTRGRSAVSHMLEPSTAEHVVRRARIPVLTIHAADVSDGIAAGGLSPSVASPAS
jgi:universal stress protein A